MVGVSIRSSDFSNRLFYKYCAPDGAGARESEWGRGRFVRRLVPSIPPKRKTHPFSFPLSVLASLRQIPVEADIASNEPPRVHWKRNKGRSGESILHFGLGRKKQIALLRSSKRKGGSLLQICRSYRSCGEPLPMNLRGFIGKMNHKTVVGVSYGAWNIILGLFDK